MTPLVLLLIAAPALAQPADCPAQPVGPPMAIDAIVGRGPAFAAIGLDNVPSQGTICDPTTPLPTDILHGPPAPGGLLRGTPE
jgi:hypothetical protein